MDDSDLFSPSHAPQKKTEKVMVDKADVQQNINENKTPLKPKEVGHDTQYSASDIEVLEGLEPVRRRPGMYIGGTDENALHHLFAEVIDNSMDEAVAGHATRIDVELFEDGRLQISDNGRGIPVDPHPKMPDKSALEVILTTLHAGGKFDSKVYETSGGLHGVGISVVNALSDHLTVEVARGRRLYKQHYARGVAQGALEDLGDVMNRRGTSICFHPDPEIFGENLHFKPQRLFRMARSKAYLFGGVEIRWKCASSLISEKETTPSEARFIFHGGLQDYLEERLQDSPRICDELFAGKTSTTGKHGSVEWAIGWHIGDTRFESYCNTIPTRDGGTHEQGLRLALLRGLKSYGEMIGHKRASIITSEDLLTNMSAMLSVFVREPEFVGQTKDKLSTSEASRIVDTALRDAFDHWLTASPSQASKLLDWVLERADERLRRKQEREVSRKTATRKLRLPGKLADCSNSDSKGSELFIVEGDSAGGSAKQARNRYNQAILPLRGKILNVANSTRDKIIQNQQLGDLLQALGCGVGSAYSENDLRYERIIIMTDADVDGAHIASLLITFFYSQMPDLIRQGHLFLAVPPLYRITAGQKTLYAKDDHDLEHLLQTEFKGRSKIDIGRFKGLGEMMPAQLKETTMHPDKRTLLRIALIDQEDIIKDSVTRLMGNKPEERFRFIQDRAAFTDPALL